MSFAPSFVPYLAILSIIFYKFLYTSNAPNVQKWTWRMILRYIRYKINRFRYRGMLVEVTLIPEYKVPMYQTESIFLLVVKIYDLILNLVFEIISTKYQRYTPIVFNLFLTILVLNLIGMVPSAFTVTAHLIITFFIGINIFLALNMISFFNFWNKITCIILPSATSILLSLFLIPLEIISYCFKPISLSVRLFANLMAGHTLIKIIIGFG